MIKPELLNIKGMSEDRVMRKGFLQCKYKGIHLRLPGSLALDQYKDQIKQTKEVTTLGAMPIIT